MGIDKQLMSVDVTAHQLSFHQFVISHTIRNLESQLTSIQTPVT